jgi:tol-pal system protein YbgF
MALCALFFVAGCRTAGPIAQSSTDFRLQNIEAALVKMQGEVKALEDKQAQGDKTWGEVRAKIDELAQLVRARSGDAGAASVRDAPPPWAGQPAAAPPAEAPSKSDKQPTPYAASGRAAPNGKGQPAPPSDVGRPFPAVPPGQTAQAVQAASTAAPTPPPAPAPSPPPAMEPAPPSPAAELASAGAPATAPAPVSTASPGGNPAKAWELPGPDVTASASKPAALPPGGDSAVKAAPAISPPSSLSPYPAVLPPGGDSAVQAAPAVPAQATPVATAVQGPEPVPGRAPTPLAPTPSPAPGPVSGKPSAGEEADYNKALKLALNGKPREAKAAFSDFLARHPQSALSPNVRYWIGESDYIQGNMSQAAQSFSEVSTRYAGHHKAADSLYKLGMVQEKLGDTAAARTAYETLVRDYPSSELTGNAKRKLEQLPR